MNDILFVLLFIHCSILKLTSANAIRSQFAYLLVQKARNIYIL